MPNDFEKLMLLGFDLLIRERWLVLEELKQLKEDTALWRERMHEYLEGRKTYRDILAKAKEQP